jgi:hypothetical protein
MATTVSSSPTQMLGTVSTKYMCRRQCQIHNRAAVICLCGGQQEVSSLRLPASFCFRKIVQSLHFPEGSPSVLRPDYFDLSTHQYWIYANHIDHEVPNRPTWITQQAGANANPSNTILISPIYPTILPPPGFMPSKRIWWSCRMRKQPTIERKAVQDVYRRALSIVASSGF